MKITNTNMTRWQQDKSIYSPADAPWSADILRLVGYSLLVLALFDVIAILVPLHLMNPLWEFQTIGSFVERVAVPLLGLGLVFYGEECDRRRWEFPLLRVLSWSCLLFGLLFLLLIPLGVSDGMRLHALTALQATAQYDQQQQRVEQVEQQVGAANPKQLDNLLKSQGHASERKNPQEIKQQLLAQVTSTKQKMQMQYQEAEANQQLNLTKNSVKWSLGALVSAVLFIYIWRLTNWAR